MANETILCRGCGITMVAFMKVCPRCGAEREDARPVEPQMNTVSDAATSSASSVPPLLAATEESESSEAVKTSVIPLGALRSDPIAYDEEEFAPPQNFVLLSPNEQKRRFPLFTNAQLTLIAVGVGLILLGLVIAGLLWRQQRRDVFQSANAAAAQMAPAAFAGPTPEPSPTPTPIDDQGIFESVKSTLMAYNPLGFSRYKFEVKDGVVTLNGEAEHQPEKDGAENVVRLLIGVKSVVNNLQLKPAAPGFSTDPVKLNLAEARLLDEAMRRQLQDKGQEYQQASITSQPTPDLQREAERLRREQLAAKQREEEAALRAQAEEKIKREAEDYERRLEESRRVEADRRARAEQARVEASSLRYGTIAWNGVVDGVDEIIISGTSASVRHLNGAPPREVRASFSAPMPRAPVEAKLIWVNGRGALDIIQQPSAANGYTAIIRIDDSSKGGDKRYEFTLRWSLLQ